MSVPLGDATDVGRRPSLYRAESLLLPIVILLTRLRSAFLAALAIVCVQIGYKMAQLFFTAVLV